MNCKIFSAPLRVQLKPGSIVIGLEMIADPGAQRAGRWCGRCANNYKPLHCYHWHILTTSVLVYPSLYLSSYPTFGYILSP